MVGGREDGPKPGAWMVALACCWINLFVFAVFRSGGVLYMALVRTFGCSHAEAAWPITLASAVASITCLPAGFLSHYFHVKTIVSCGILITSFSIAICFFTNSIASIIVFLGTTQGIGIGFITGLLPVIISDYFGKKCTSACGLSYAGAGVGAFFFPILFQLLLDEFGLRGSLLIMAALSFHAMCGALLLSPAADRRATGAGTGAHDREIRRRSALSLMRSGLNVSVYDPEAGAEVENDLSRGAASPSGNRIRSSDSCDTGGWRICHTSSRRECVSERIRPSLAALDRSREQEATLLHESSSPEDVSDNGSLTERKDEETVVDCGSLQQQQQSRPSSSWKQILAQMAHDARILRERHFFLITLTYVSYILGSVSLLMILPDYVVNLGQERSTAVLLLSYFSVTDLLGRLSPGFLNAVSPSLSNKFLYVFSIGFMGALLMLFPLLVPHMDPENVGIILICLTLCCGFTSGCQMILPAVLAAELLGQKNTAMAFAMSNFICGFFSFSRPFIFRRLVDPSSTGSSRYDSVFYIFGSFALISCLAWILEAVICKLRAKKKDSLTIK